MRTVDTDYGLLFNAQAQDGPRSGTLVKRGMTPIGPAMAGLGDRGRAAAAALHDPRILLERALTPVRG